MVVKVTSQPITSWVMVSSVILIARLGNLKRGQKMFWNSTEVWKKISDVTHNCGPGTHLYSRVERGLVVIPYPRVLSS